MGTGDKIGAPMGMALDLDGALFVCDLVFAAIIRVDTARVDRTCISNNNGKGGGPLFGSPFGIALEQDGQLVVTDGGFQAIFRVDPATVTEALYRVHLLGKDLIL